MTHLGIEKMKGARETLTGDMQSERIMQQQVEITEAQEKLQSLENNNSKLQGEVDALKQLIDTKKAEADRETQRRERLEKEARELKSAIGTRTSEIKQKELQLKSAEEQQVRVCVCSVSQHQVCVYIVYCVMTPRPTNMYLSCLCPFIQSSNSIE